MAEPLRVSLPEAVAYLLELPVSYRYKLSICYWRSYVLLPDTRPLSLARGHHERGIRLGISVFASQSRGILRLLH